MTYALLIKKLYFDEKKFVEGNTIKDYCKALNMKYYSAIIYLTNNKYLIRILKGIFYKPSIEERKLKKMEISHLEAIKIALKIKGVKNWYYGLETAIKLNNFTHEFYNIDYVLSDKIFRAKPILVMGRKIKFIKLKKDLFGFGTLKNKFPYSDPEKTLLDIAYISKYNGLSDKEIKAKIVDLINHCSKHKILRYSKKYSETTRKLMEVIT